MKNVFEPGYFRQLELLKLRSKRAYLGSRQGGHVSLKRGHGIEFSDFRKYELGDNPRHIDWGVYARTERLYVKRYQEEQALSVLIICDGTASMSTPPDEGKWEMARDIALSLAYVALMQHDSVRICVPGAFVSPAFSTGGGFHRFRKMLDTTEREGSIDFVRECQRALAQVRFPGMAVVISDLLMPIAELREVINMMRARNLDIQVIQVLSASDLNPLQGESSAIAIDSETGREIEIQLDDSVRAEYAYRLAEHNREIQEFLVRQGITFAQTNTTIPVPQFVTARLAGGGLLS